jgi:hypothetical protein
MHPYVHTHFVVGWVLSVALKRCVLMQQGKWLHPSLLPHRPFPTDPNGATASPIAGGILLLSAEETARCDAMSAFVYILIPYQSLP